MAQMKTDVLKVLELLEKKLGTDYYWKKYKKPLPLIFSDNFFVIEATSQFDQFVLIIPFDSNVGIELVRGVCSYIKEKPIVYIENKALAKEVESYGIYYFNRLGQYCSPTPQSEMSVSSYTKLTQLVVKYLLLSKSNLFSTRQVAEFFGVSNASIKRAYDFLENVGAIQKVGVYTSSVSYNIKSKKHLLDCVKKHFILPYKRITRTFVNYGVLDHFAKDMFYSAEHVLARVSSLANPDEIELAASAKVFNNLIHENSKKILYGDELVTIEEWIYKIDYFSITNEIDLVDAYIIVSKRYENTIDSRISAAIKQLEGTITSDK